MGKEKVKLLKNGPIPLYHQLKEVLKKQIENGELKQGERLPSEIELINTYEVSRTTIREAVNDLVQNGYLVRKRGVGTYVATPKHSQWVLENLSSFAEELEQKGLSSKTEVLSLEKIQSGLELKSIFGSEYTEFYSLERLRYVDEKPAVVVTTYVPVSLAPGLEEIDLSENSLYKTLLNTYKLDIHHANRTILATNVEDKDATLLEVPPNSAIQLIETVAYLSDGTPFEYSVSRNRADLSSFKASLKYKK